MTPVAPQSSPPKIADWNLIYSDWRLFLAFGFGSGLVKPGPGTWGTLMGLVFFLSLYGLSPALFWLSLAFGTLMGDYLCDHASKALNSHDHGGIVWDEMLAIGWLLGLMPIIEQNFWLSVAVAFVLFRIFDIVKPWPIGYFDRNLHTGLGIMLDDFLAMLMALAVMTLLVKMPIPWSICC